MGKSGLQRDKAAKEREVGEAKGKEARPGGQVSSPGSLAIQKPSLWIPSFRVHPPLSQPITKASSRWSLQGS